MVTGTYQSVREVGVGTLSALTGSSYGQILLLKSGLFAVLIGLGYVGRAWFRRNRSVPTDDDANKPHPPSAAAGLRRSVMAETAIGAAVLAVTAVLVATTQARRPRTRMSPITVPPRRPALRVLRCPTGTTWR